jgi:hypothetical protein
MPSNPAPWTARTNGELEEWLGSNTWFEGAEVVGVAPGPGEPASLNIRLTVQIHGDYRAGSHRVVRDFELRAMGVQQTGPIAPLSFVPGHCCEGLEICDVEEGILFRINVPDLLEVRCAQLKISVGDERTERTKPWLSNREMGLSQPGAPTPSPAEWIQLFERQGLSVRWRIYGGPAVSSPADATDYTGWFLQVPERIGAVVGGLYFFSCRQHEGAFLLHWQLMADGDAGSLWAAARRVAAEFAEARIWCGNCEFSTDEWREYLAGGRLPTRWTSP